MSFGNHHLSNTLYFVSNSKQKTRTFIYTFNSTFCLIKALYKTINSSTNLDAFLRFIDGARMLAFLYASVNVISQFSPRVLKLGTLCVKSEIIFSDKAPPIPCLRSPSSNFPRALSCSWVLWISSTTAFLVFKAKLFAQAGIYRFVYRIYFWK